MRVHVCDVGYGAGFVGEMKAEQNNSEGNKDIKNGSTGGKQSEQGKRIREGETSKRNKE